MARQPIGIGTIANDGTGDPLRDAFDKINDNFIELYDDDANDVNSVNGQTGTVILDTDDIGEGATNKYDKTVVLTQGDNVTITGTYPNFTISSNDVVGEVSSVSAGDGISVNSTTGNVVVTNTITNNNQLTNGAGYVDGSGTANYVPKWTDGDTIGNSVIYDDGTNVGIGTASPTVPLHINIALDGAKLKLEGGTFQNGIDFASTTTAAGDSWYLFNGTYNSVDGFGIFNRTDSSLPFFVNSGGDISFRDSSANEAFYWDASTARLGLGTTSPVFSLDIRGAVNIQNTITSQLFLQSNSGAYASSINVGGTGNGLGYTTGQLYFENSNNSITFNTKTGAGESMRIDSAGNVGIGTVPSAWGSGDDALELGGGNQSTVSGNVAMVTAAGAYFDGSNWRYRHTGVKPTLQTQSYTGEHLFFGATNGTAGNTISFSERMRIDSSGNVGIGRSSIAQPTAGATTLAIQGTTTTSAGAIRFHSSNDSVQSYMFTDNANGFSINTITSHPLVFRTVGSERMRITSAGAIHLSQGTGNTYVGSNAGNLGTSTGTNNSAFGLSALYNNTTGINNTANGKDALALNTTASNNTANGFSALYYNTTGTNNSAFGVAALFNNTTGSENTANGYQTLVSNTTGSENVANGYRALYSNTTGVNNTANGLNALFYNTTGNYNTANGTSALQNNTTATSNTATGHRSLYLNTTGNYNTATGVESLRSNTTGNSNVASGMSALYSNTTGNNNIAVGQNALYYNTTASNNVASGVEALLSNTTGGSNTANGYQALYNNTTANNNTATGYRSLYLNTTGTQNTAYGVNALYYNTVGYNNTAVGVNAMQINTTGGENSAFGNSALFSNTTGSYNVANGLSALYSNTTGGSNTANGLNSLYANTTGGSNTANGSESLRFNTTGGANTANGKNVLYSNTTGSYNSAFGVNALFSNTTGSGNIVIGSLNNAGVYAPVFNITTQNNYISMGSTSVTNAYIKVAWTVTSDARDKTNFGEVPHGLDFVSKLKPISYNFKESRDSDIAVGDVKYGFKAQDILALEGDNNVIINAEDEDKLRYNETNLIPILVKAIQELKAEIELLKNK